MRTRFRTWFILWIPLFLLSTVPVFSSWLKNRYQVTLEDLALPLILGALLSLIASFVSYRLFKKDRFAGLAAALFMVLVSESPLTLQDISTHSTLFSILLFVVLLITGVVIGAAVAAATKRTGWKTVELAKGVVVVIGVIFILEAFPVGRAIVTEWHQFFYKPAALVSQATAPSDKPDIYYIVLDRYTSPDILKTDFNFDDSAFTSFLSSHDFSVDPNAHSNYPYTTMSIASTLIANYHTALVQQFSKESEQTTEPYHDSIRYSPVISELKSFGYQYYHLGTWYEASNKAPQADYYYQPQGQLYLFNHRFTLNSFGTEQLEDSILRPFFSKNIHIGAFTIFNYTVQGEVDATLSKLTILKQLADAPSGGRFIFAHFLVPHDPYYFNADGTLSSHSSNDNTGASVQNKYTGQVQFINNEVEDVITSIDQQSGGKAIIVMQADEGPYPMVMLDQNFNGERVGDELSTGNMLDWSDQALQMKYGILAAYRLPGVSADQLAQGDDSVNIFRLIFNTYFHDSQPFLPRCYYAYVNGREQSFAYTDITKRITGQSNSACPADSNFGSMR